MIDPNILPQLTYQLFNNKDYKLLSTNKGIKNDDDLNMGTKKSPNGESDDESYSDDENMEITGQFNGEFNTKEKISNYY